MVSKKEKELGLLSSFFSKTEGFWMFTVVSLTTTVSFIARFMFFTLYWLFQQKYGLNVLQVGLIGFVYDIAGFICFPLWILLAQKFSSRILITMSTLIFGIFTTLISFIDIYLLIIIFRGISGIASFGVYANQITLVITFLS